MSHFNDHWAEFDPKGTYLIPLEDLRPLIKRIIEQEAQMIIEARKKVSEGELENFDMQNMIFMFELYKNDYLSGLSLIKQAEF
jgi:hypothetical protein